MDGKNHESKTADHRPNSFQLAKYRSSRAIRRKKFQFPAVPGNENAKLLSSLKYFSCSYRHMDGKNHESKTADHRPNSFQLAKYRSSRAIRRKNSNFRPFLATKMRNYFPP
jgi:hypothetical protein